MMSPDRTEPCPACGHLLGVHQVELGCTHGWVVTKTGAAITEGCECPLTLAQQFNPPSEAQP